MRRYLVGAMFVLAAAIGAIAPMPSAAQQMTITGAGASFPFPLYSTWFSTFGRENGVRINYQSVGSGAGVRNFINRITDFGASDAAMSDQEIAEVDSGVVILPMTAGEIVLAYNLDGTTGLRLPREVYPLIFAGEITRWNDERIAAANPEIELPDRQITVVRRSDSSGTTFVFTKHLSAINETFAKTVGEGTTVPWPSLPSFIGSPRNDGVTATVTQTPGAIGYIEYFFAVSTNTPMAELENASGEFVAPGPDSGQAALASVDYSTDDLRLSVTDPSDPAAYPIATLTWMIFHRDHGNPEIQAVLRDFVAWAVTDGQGMASDLGYIPLPAGLSERVIAESANIQ